MDILSQIAARLNIPVEQLIAVIFHNDEQWSKVRVYGSEIVAQCIEADYEWAEVVHHSFDELAEVPDSDRNCASEVYGVRGGRILLVQGLPR